MPTVFEGVQYNIFQDPVTKEKFEGVAIVECVKCEQDEYLCRCDVLFQGETEPYERLVDCRELVDIDM